ncbi:Nup133 N terminal like-domain-containing protein [Hyaloraphidium curvatum]|nr:Nup133 N terminal like-domain-containing protein [Hyaloraphidium curvatum]
MSGFNWASLRGARDFIKSLGDADTYPDLAELLSNGASPPDYAQIPELQWQLIQKRRSQPFPVALLEQYEHLQTRSFLGVFPEISRAWFTVDNRLYFLDYETGTDLYAFQDQDQIIVSVGLAKPIPGVFLDNIEYVVVVATPLEIFLLAAAFEKTPDGGRGAMNLYQTQMSVAADGVSMTSIVGSAEGRIFMGGNNGNIYELVYHAEESWYRRRCYKTNYSSPLGYFLPAALRFGSEDPCVSLVVDNERKLLHSLTASGSIELVYLGSDGKGFNRIAKVSELWRLVNQLPRQGQPVDPKVFRIISIHVIAVVESRSWQLVALTSNGDRLFFSCYPPHPFGGLPGGMAAAPSQPQVPVALQLVHVRAAPPQQPSQVAPGGLKYHQGLYQNGFLLVACAINGEVDSLVAAGSDYRRPEQPKKLHEVCGSILVESRSLAISPYLAGSAGSVSDLINQVSKPPPQFLVLTSSGLTVLERERPIDVLFKLIRGLPESYGAISRFFDHFGRDEAALMCLLVAAEIPDLQRPAMELYYDRSGEAELTLVQPVGVGLQAADVGRPIDTPRFAYSGRLNGLALLVSRITRPVWTSPILRRAADAKGQSVVTPGVPLKDLVQVKLRLATLRNVLSRYMNVRDPNRVPGGVKSPDAAKSEQQLVFDVMHLLSETIQAVEFIEILHELNLPDAFNQLPEARRDDLCKQLSLETIVVDQESRKKGVQIVQDLFKLNQASRGSVDALTASFQQRCPSFVAARDIVWFKGMEILERAMNVAGPERDAALMESQRLWLREAQNMTPDRVAEIAALHRNLGSFSATVELALACASASDPEGAALKYSEGIDTSMHAKAAYDVRSRCYDIAIKAIEECFAGSLEQMQKQLITMSFKSSDTLFLFSLYDWLLLQGKTDLLLEGEPESLEKFLLRSPTLEKSNLLWLLLVKTKQYLKASRVLVGLAETKGRDIPLPKRVEYLSLALSNARSASAGQEDAGALLSYVIDRLQVAQVQLEIMEAVAARVENTSEKEHAINQLNSGLFDVTDLFKEFSAKYGLYDSILALLHISGNAPDGIVLRTWSEILKEARAQGSSSSDNHRAVAERVQSLGARFHGDENVFPVYLLCKALEDYSFKHGVEDKAWVVRIMLSVGVPFSELFEKYDVMFLETKARGGASADHIAEAMCALIESWLQTDPKGLRANVRAVNDVLVKFMLNGTNARLGRLQESLKSTFSVSDY